MNGLQSNYLERKKVFFVGIHEALSYSFSHMLRQSNWEVYSPNQSFATEIYRHRWKNKQKGFQPQLPEQVNILSRKEFLAMDLQVIILMSFELDRSRFWALVAKAKPGAAIVHFSGNEGVPYRKDRICSLISADTSTQHMTNPLRHQPLLPVLPFKAFPPRTVDDVKNASPRVGSYILKYASHFPYEHSIFSQLASILKSNGIEAINYEHEPRKECDIIRRRSLLTVHFKSHEGYGFSVIESMASGVPVIIHKNLVSRQNTLSKLCRECHGTWIVDNPSEAAKIIWRAHNDRNFLAEQSFAAAESIRSAINEDEQICNLDTFLRESITAGRVYRRFGYLPWGWFDISQEKMLANIRY